MASQNLLAWGQLPPLSQFLQLSSLDTRGKEDDNLERTAKTLEKHALPIGPIKAILLFLELVHVESRKDREDHRND